MVVGYDKNGVKCYEFNCAEDATKHIKVHRSSIPKCASGESKTVKGIAWFYIDIIKNLNDDEILLEVEKRFTKLVKSNSGSFKKGQKGLQSKDVMMYDLEWNFIREFESAKVAGEYIGVTGGAIQHACLKSKKQQCKNNKFKYKTV